MGEQAILGSVLNGIGTNILAGNNPVKGALMNASMLAGSGNIPAAIPSGVPPPTPVIPGIQGGVSSIFSNPTIPQTYSIPGLVGGPSNVFSAASNPMTESMVNGMNFPLTPGGVKPVAEPSFFDSFKGFARENPMLTQMGFSTTKDLLTPDQINPAPAVPVQARGQLRDYNPIASMDPYKQSVIGSPQISLI